MADISLCMNKDCPKADTCYRAKARPNEFRQSYIKPEKMGDECMFYWQQEPLPEIAEEF